MAATNLDKFSTGNNGDWSLWVKLVKRTYKSQGHNLTQAQALMLAKQSYPGKGNVVGKPEESFNIPIANTIPPNPVRRKKAPAPKNNPDNPDGSMYRRERPQNYREKYRSPARESDGYSRRRSPDRRDWESAESDRQYAYRKDERENRQNYGRREADIDRRDVDRKNSRRDRDYDYDSDDYDRRGSSSSRRR